MCMYRRPACCLQCSKREEVQLTQMHALLINDNKLEQPPMSTHSAGKGQGQGQGHGQGRGSWGEREGEEEGEEKEKEEERNKNHEMKTAR